MEVLIFHAMVEARLVIRSMIPADCVINRKEQKSEKCKHVLTSTATQGVDASIDTAAETRGPGSV